MLARAWTTALKTLLAALLVTCACTALALPEQCLQLPERIEVCPHLIYKRSPVDVPTLEIKTNAIVCLCMADFIKLRIEASARQEKIEQTVELKRIAGKLGMPEQVLLNLIRG